MFSSLALMLAFVSFHLYRSAALRRRGDALQIRQETNYLNLIFWQRFVLESNNRPPQNAKESERNIRQG